MIPNIFISSTIEDLQHLRDGIRDTIKELAYTPIMSEYGDVGYIPTSSAEGACYHSIKECQLAILLVGKRYGSVGDNGKSVTHNELLHAKEYHIPVITLIDQEVLSFKRVYDANELDKKPECIPGMDNHEGTFQLVQEIIEAPLNNGILAYSNVSDARQHIKRQIAMLFGELLTKAVDPLNAGIKDVISEIKTLRHEVSSGSQPDFKFLSTIRFLIDDSNQDLRSLIERSIGPIDTAIQSIYKEETFESFLKANNIHLKIDDDVDHSQSFFERHSLECGTTRPGTFRRTPEGNTNMMSWGVSSKGEVIMTPRFLDDFKKMYAQMRRVTWVSQGTPKAT